jgi:peroxiredoxin
MFRMTLAVLVAAGLSAANPAVAGEFNKKLNIGDAAPAWTGLEGVDGKTHSLADLKNKDVVVVIITCNHCPVAVAYEDRIIDFTKKYASAPDSKVAVVAINVNNLEADKLPAMKVRAKEKGFNFPYLYDPTQKIGRDYGATVTPEFFVLNKERKIVYMGAMDDSNNAASAKVNYLEAAVQAALNGQKPATAETRGRGCSVKYEASK